MKQLFDDTSYKICEIITKKYSTSFSIGVRLFSRSIRPSIYAIYGFVRLADEIVDSFHQYDRQDLLQGFVEDYHLALRDRISINPVLNAFQAIVHRYQLHDYVEDFIRSMSQDLHKSSYSTKEEYESYIYGSADVVGLMCLQVFVDGDSSEFNRLKTHALKLGSAFQKVNFMRDIQYDIETLGRSYFPSIDFNHLDEASKASIMKEIHMDFQEALQGIKKLPAGSRLGVYVAYRYYLELLKKLSRTKACDISNTRIRVSNVRKFAILNESIIRYRLNVL